jgi:crossover junction endodeoxyribonuclease RusA
MLILPYPPTANKYWRHARGRTYKSAEAVAYQETVGWQCKALGLTPERGDICIMLRLYRPQRRGDLDNRIKILLDALNGFIYVDDAQIVRLVVDRLDDRRNPRVEVEWAKK